MALPRVTMTDGPRNLLSAHLRRHARALHAIACGFGRHRDADDVIQILYQRWWLRLQREPEWTPPESPSALFVCVKRVIIDEVDRERRRTARDRAAPMNQRTTTPPDVTVEAFDRIRWILDRLPEPMADVLSASLGAGRRRDAEVAATLGLAPAAYTTRLYRARRAAEELASFYDRLPSDQAQLMAEMTYGGKTRAQIADERRLLVDELEALWRDARDALRHAGTAVPS
ncbi:MAG: hypothetical protein AAGN82_24720 [Myxococcota bacterium]